MLRAGTLCRTSVCLCMLVLVSVHVRLCLRWYTFTVGPARFIMPGPQLNLISICKSSAVFAIVHGCCPCACRSCLACELRVQPSAGKYDACESLARLWTDALVALGTSPEQRARHKEAGLFSCVRSARGHNVRRWPRSWACRRKS